MRYARLPRQCRRCKQKFQSLIRPMRLAATARVRSKQGWAHCSRTIRPKPTRTSALPASNQAIYSYKYSGGNGPGGGGNAEFNGRGNANVIVQLQSDQRYTISNVAITNDPNHQLSWVDRAPRTANIHNVNTAVQTAYY